MADNSSAGAGPAESGLERTGAERSEESADLAASLRELSELATGEMPLRDLLTKVAEYAVRAIPGAEGAGLTLIAQDRSETLVSTTKFVSDVDAIQYAIRQGPCITAANAGETVVSHSLGEDERWPEFGDRVSDLGVHSALSLPLITPGRVVGAMNIYARKRNVFDERSASLGQLFAVPAAIAVQNGQVLAQARELAHQLQTALTTRATIDRAIGILVGRDGISTQEADRRLRAASHAEDKSVSELAGEILRQAERRDPTPGSGAAAGPTP